MSSILKNPRVLIWIFFIVISIILIAPNPSPSGVMITYKDRNSSLTLSVNDVIYKINDQVATKDIVNYNYSGVVKFDTSKGQKLIKVNGTLGIAVDDVQSTNLKFGLDLKGGVHAVIEPNTSTNETLQQIISTLQTRINVYGLREAVFRSTTYENKGFVEISIAGGNENELRDLLERQGMFEGKIKFALRPKNSQITLKLDRDYALNVKADSLEIGGKDYKVNDAFTLAGITFTADQIGEYVNLTANVFSGTDIRTVYFDPQHSRIEMVGAENYKWMFGIQISPDSAQKFAWITGNMNVIPGVGTENYLDGKIILYLDGKPIDELNIVSSLKGKVETEISITGGSKTRDEASKERSRLQSILRSGALPTSITIAQLDTISPNLGVGFLKNAAIAGLVAILGVLVVVSIRYRKPKLVIPMAAISFSEVLIILGIAVIINWTIDLPAIAGIIASVGTGIDSQIVILDQALRGETRITTFKEKLKRAFFIIFGSAGTVIAAMLPLMALGFGMLRGFAITTVIGVLVGVFIARPAYSVIVERLQRHHTEENV
jgi:preprotein translocase subunit SecD